MGKGTKLFTIIMYPCPSFSVTVCFCSEMCVNNSIIHSYHKKESVRQKETVTIHATSELSG